MEQLEEGDREKDHDDEGSQRFELTVSVRVIFVRRLGGEANDDHAKEIVHGIYRGVNGVSEDGERVCREPY